MLIESRESCRNSLLDKWTYLKENFDPFHIIDKLYNNGLVDEDRGEIIRAKPRIEQVYSVLTNIWRKVDRPKMFETFINILKEENNFIADELQKKTTNNAVGRDQNNGENKFDKLFDPSYDAFITFSVLNESLNPFKSFFVHRSREK